MYAEKESSLRAIIDHVLDGLITIDERGNVQTFNPACENIFGYHADEVIGRNIKMLMPEPYHSEHDEYLSHYRETGQEKIIGTAGREVLGRRKDGSVFPMDLSVSEFAHEGRRYFSGIIRDITARKEAEKSLRESEQRLNFALESTGIGAWELNLTDKTALRSLGHDAIFGYAQMLPKWTYAMFLDHVIPEDRALVDGAFQHAVETKTDWDFECRIRRADGEQRRIWAKGRPHFDSTGETFKMSGIVQDITTRKLAEEVIKDNATHLAAVFNTVLDGLIVINNSTVIQEFNGGAERIFGYKAEEVIGRSVKMLMPEAHHGEHDDNIREFLKTGIGKVIGIEGRELKAKRKDGSIFPIELSINQFDIGKEPTFVGVIRDITVRRMTEKNSAMLLASIVASSDDAIISKTLDGIITSWNSSAERLFGYTAEEAAGQNITIIIPPECIEEEKNILEQLHKGMQIHHFATARMNKDGQRIEILLTVSPILDEAGQVVGASKIIRDNRERKKSETAIKHYMKSLERSNAELEKFSYAASHDLKAPLRVIQNATKWLEEDLQEHLTGESRDNMNLLRGRVARMEKMLDDLLEYARIGRTAKAPSERIVGDALIRNVLELLSPPQDFVVIVSPGFADITVSRMPLQQVFMNLIGNAIKHHDKKYGRIEVTTAEAGAFYSFAVTDDGPGIPAQFHEKIFEIFQTLKPRDQVEGSGIGLALVRKSIELVGGTLELDSTEGKGSTFRFTWPKSQQVTAA